MNKKPEITEATRQRLIDAFWSLAMEEQMPHITASGVAKKAGVNRSTFYEYFLDIVDLTDQVENQFIESFAGKIEQYISEEHPISLEKFYQLSAQIFPQVGDKMFYLLALRQSHSFERKLRQRMRPFLLYFTGLREDTPNLSYLQTYILSTVRGIFLAWYEDGKQVPFEKILPMGQKLIAEGILGYAKTLREVETR